MSICSEQNRVVCAMGGIYTALAIEKVLPIMHSGPGCGWSASMPLARGNGKQAALTYFDSAIPTTNFCEGDVVFGGAGRLRILTEKVLKYYKLDLAVIVDGCTAEIVGDDIEEIAGDFSTPEKPVLFTALPGFKGDNLWGHSQILHTIINQYLVRRPHGNPQKGLVNIFGIVPYYDPMWIGTLEQLEIMLRIIGLEPNIIYGKGKGLAAVNRIPEAEFNLVIGPWVDLDVVNTLKTAFGTPYFQYPCVPIGATETSSFLRALTKYAKLDAEKTEEYIRVNEDRYYEYVWHFIKDWFAGSMFPKRFFVNASAAAAVSVVRFLINDLEMIPQKIYIPENIPEEYQADIEAWIKEPDYDGKEDFEVVFTNDGGLCNAEVRDIEWLTRACIFGSTWDEMTAKNKSFPYVAISAPYGDWLIVNKSYFGYDGGLEFFRDFHNDAIRKFQGSGTLVFKQYG